MADKDDDLLTRLANALAARTTPAPASPGSGSGIRPGPDFYSTDSAKQRAAQKEYVGRLTDTDMTKLSSDEKAIIRREIDATLKDSGFGS